MLGSDKHHICLKVTNINDLYSSYHKRARKIEAYYQENTKVSDIVTSLGRSKQTIYNVINYLKEGHSAYDYYNRYKVNKKRFGRNKTRLTQSEKDFIQTHLEQNWSLDVIKGTYSDMVTCSIRILY